MEPPLHNDFRYGRITSPVPSARFTELLVCDDEGTTCLHLAATCGGFELIPLEVLTRENLLRRDKRGDTPLHLAAFTGRLRELPLASLDPTVFNETDGDGSSVIEIARKKGHLGQLPHELIVTLPFYQRDLILRHLRERDLQGLPLILFRQDLWQENLEELRDAGTLYHEAARHNLLDCLPDSIIGPNVWALKDRKLRTPPHLVAALGEQGALGKLVRKAGISLPWLLMDADGETLFHAAARGNQLSAVPAELLSKEHLQIKNRQGETVVDLAYVNECIHAVPEPYRVLNEAYARGRLRHCLTTGDSKGLPAEYFTKEFLYRLLPSSSGEDSALQLVVKHGTYHLLPADLLDEIANGALAGSGLSPVHAAAAAGRLDKLPSRLLTRELLQKADASGRTAFHIAIAGGFIKQLPKDLICPEDLLDADHHGVTAFHLVASQPDLGSVPAAWFTQDVLLLQDSAGRSVADVAEDNGNTHLLPRECRGFSRKAFLARFESQLLQDYPAAAHLADTYDGPLATPEELGEIAASFAQDWAHNLSPTIRLDPQQAETAARSASHLQVVARAGSGKTRCLVTRALFLIKHCGINPRTILILAFNRKAVAEVRARLAQHLDEEDRPHVLTFHSLAWRIVRPSENILFDEEGSDEAKRLSQAIQEIIRSQLRDGNLEADLRDLMRINWEDSLARIIQKGFDLPEDDFIALRERMHDTTLDGRRVETESHKWIGDFLLRHGLNYSYRPTVWRQSGKSYSPAFRHTTTTGRNILIEAVGKQKEDAQAAASFWASDRSVSSVAIRFDPTDLASRTSVVEKLQAAFEELGLGITRLGREELWARIRDRVIDDFTNSVRGFISRCQKECLWPDQLANVIEARTSASDLQSRFWRLSLDIFRLYEQELGDRFTDFDRLMLEAAERIASGSSVFSSQSGRSDLRDLTHILIDEFQDFSLLFDKLRTSMVSVNSKALFFCVGDDWQAINRFAGSNLRYFSDFTSQFRPNKSLEITTNYRSAEGIVAMGNQVMSGYGVPSRHKPNALPGKIQLAKSAKGSELSPEEDAVNDRFGQLAVDILRLAQMEGMPLHRNGHPGSSSGPDSPNEKIAVLTRTLSLPTPNGMLSIERWEKGIKKFLREEHRDRLEFSTVHGYKGREATAVIVLEPENYPLIHPDAVLAEIFGDTYQSLVDDERRLFYVGVTRAEKTLILLQTNPDAPIAFLSSTNLEKVDVSRLGSDLLIGDEVVVSLRNAPSIRDLSAGGTMPLKDTLKEPRIGFSWKPQQNAWMRRFPIEDLPDAPAFLAYLRNQGWIGQADQIIARLTGDRFHVEFLVTTGQLQRIGAALTSQQKEELDCLSDDHREPIGSMLEHLHLDLGLPWPEFGYEGMNEHGICDGSMLSVAWPDHKVGISIPGDNFDDFATRGWMVQSADAIDRRLLVTLLSDTNSTPLPPQDQVP